MDSYCTSKCVKETSSVPSFSSTLLEAIYHSIEVGNEKMLLYNETMKKKNISSSSYERACRVEKWIENQVCKNEVIAKKSGLDFERKRLTNDNALFIKSSSSGSSDSSSGIGFSSSETESIGHGVSFKPMGSCYGLPKPKPVKKTEKYGKNINVGGQQERRDLCDLQTKPKSETNFVRSKSSRALRIYRDLKKVKQQQQQPISPGGRVSSFLNYFFVAGNTKKTSNNEIVRSETSLKSANASTCSTASSFSRSCMSNSRGKSSNGNKRTVRFYPVSVIVDEDCQPCGEKKLYDHDDEDIGLSQFRPNEINKGLKSLAMDKDRRVDKADEDIGLSQFRPNAINKELKLLAMDKDLRVDKAARSDREFDRSEFKGLSQFRPNAINKELKSLAIDKDRRVDKAEWEFDRREFKGMSQFRPNAINEELKSLAIDKDRRVDKATPRAERGEFDRREFGIRSQEFGLANDEDEDDDDESCASSDLFELDNLSAIGNGNMDDMYRQELPVYETTRVHSNTHG